MSVTLRAFLERDEVAWISAVERRVILPLKWVVLVGCVLFWVWSRDGALPGIAPFGLFYVYAGLTGAEHYFFGRDRITPRQVRPFVYTSFLLDALFVAALAVLDHLDPPPFQSHSPLSQFLPLFVLVVLRGFALFRTRNENIGGFILASLLFLGAGGWQLSRAPIAEFPGALRQLSLLWVMMLLTQGFVALVNTRKEELLRSRERLVRSQSLAALGELTAGVAHEINNPIGIIRSYIDYLEKATAASDPIREDLEAIRKEATRCQEIVRRMLDFSNPQVQGFTRLDLGELVAETVGFVAHGEDAAGVTMELVPPGRLPAIRGDGVQLKQALMNVLLNAVQVLGEQRAAAGGEGPDPRVTVELGRGTGARPPVRLVVRDNGPGISPADAERVFEPFFTRRSRGTGLGLAITRRILELHGGTISIAPDPEGGTIVTMELPMAGEEDD
jgi:signal transduction histidine kinase